MIKYFSLIILKSLIDFGFAYYYLFFFFFLLHCVACIILIPQPGIEPVPLAAKALSPNHWTTSEFPSFTF